MGTLATAPDPAGVRRRSGHNGMGGAAPGGPAGTRRTTVEFGVSIFPTDYSIDLPQLGREVEARGFDVLLFPEHTHIPASRRSPWPGGPELPRHYWHTVDPFVACAVVSQHTSR